MDFNRSNEGNSNMMTYAVVGGAVALAGYWWYTRTQGEKREMKEKARETTHDAAKRVEQATKK